MMIFCYLLLHFEVSLNCISLFSRFMGALTALLVLAALMASLTSTLPDTSYFKVLNSVVLTIRQTRQSVKELREKKEPVEIENYKEGLTKVKNGERGLQNIN